MSRNADHMSNMGATCGDEVYCCRYSPHSDFGIGRDRGIGVLPQLDHPEGDKEVPVEGIAGASRTAPHANHHVPGRLDILMERWMEAAAGEELC